MKKNKTLEVNGLEIVLLAKENEDYILLTDIAKRKNAGTPATVIPHWLSTVFSVNIMGLWEKMNNPDFNLTGFRGVKAALSQAKRLTQLNNVAIVQFKSLLEHNAQRQLKGKNR